MRKYCSKVAVNIVWNAVLAAGIGVLLASCQSGGVPSSAGSSSGAGSRAGGRSVGERLYLTRCTACHAPEPISNFSASQWRKIIPEMSLEAKLNAGQQKEVLDYVLGR